MIRLAYFSKLFSILDHAHYAHYAHHFTFQMEVNNTQYITSLVRLKLHLE